MEVEVSVSWLGEARIRLVASCPGVMSANMSLMYTYWSESLPFSTGVSCRSECLVSIALSVTSGSGLSLYLVWLVRLVVWFLYLL